MKEAIIPYGEMLVDARYRILAMILSSVPAGTRFGSGEENLGPRLAKIIRKENNEIIREHFSVHVYANYSPELEELLCFSFGRPIGLENWGLDFQYQVTEKTHEIAREIEKRGYFSKKQRKYLKSLGEKLIPEKQVTVL